MATSQAAKRLARILANEDYGPKLARMNRRDEAYILDLIDRNQGKKARAEILRLDELRRVHRRVKERERSKPQRSYVIDKNVLRRKAADSIIRKVNGKSTTVRRHVEYMENDDLQFAISAEREEIKDRARQPAYIDAPDLGYEINPFWYN